jgi:prepilin-type N-terminal cleavage/methylation domain-containing protein
MIHLSQWMEALEIRLGRSVRSCGRRAFTLIELLSVIAIIGLLAGLILGVLPAVAQRGKRGGVKTQLAALQTAIDRYHSQKGYYPPDNPTSADLPPLFYELTGTLYNETAQEYQTSVHGNQTIPAAQVASFFSIKGFLNTGSTREEAVNFYESLRPSQFKTAGANNLRVLVVPFNGTNAAKPDFNTWHYVSSNPVHNPDSYDLWAEIVIKGKTNVIGNWKE